MSIGPFANWWTSQSQNIRTKMNGWWCGGFSFCVREAGGGGKGISVVNSIVVGMVTEGWDGDGSRSDLSQMFNEWWKHCLHCFYLFLFPLFLLLTFNLDQLSCILGRCQCPFTYIPSFLKKYRNSANSWFWTSILDNAPKREIINCLVILCYS